MRVINVIHTDRESIIISLDSYAIYEDQTATEVIEEAESLFLHTAEKELGIDRDEAEMSLDEGYVCNKEGDCVSLVWSEV